MDVDILALLFKRVSGKRNEDSLHTWTSHYPREQRETLYHDRSDISASVYSLGTHFYCIMPLPIGIASALAELSNYSRFLIKPTSFDKT
jgi:hypothetical protein